MVFPSSSHVSPLRIMVFPHLFILFRVIFSSPWWYSSSSLAIPVPPMFTVTLQADMKMLNLAHATGASNGQGFWTVQNSVGSMHCPSFRRVWRVSSRRTVCEFGRWRQFVGVSSDSEGSTQKSDSNHHYIIWLVVSNIYYFPAYEWDVILPIDELHHFSEG